MGEILYCRPTYIFHRLALFHMQTKCQVNEVKNITLYFFKIWMDVVIIIICLHVSQFRSF